ncbi:MAG: hypothetical protein QXX38_03155 [Candidatus Aenigmatarchaeota archaeon]
MKKIFSILFLVFILLFSVNLVKAISEPIVQATLSTYPSIILPGNEGYVQLVLKNSGTGVASRIKISQVSYDKTIIPSGTWTGDLSPLAIGDSTTYFFKFKVSDNALPGLYLITFYIDYNSDSTTKTIKQNVIVNVQSASALELLSIAPSSLKSGEKVKMKFTITNKGSNSVNNVIFSWSSLGNLILPIGSGNRVLIPSIEGNSNYEVETEVSVSPSASPGIYPLNILLQYTDRTGVNQSISLVTGIEITGETDFDVSIEEITTNSLTLAVANTGAYTAYSVIVKIPQQQSLRLTGSSTNILGNLNAGDYTLATFQISFVNFTRITSSREMTRNFTSEERNLLVEISYTDALGIRRSVQKEISLGSREIITSSVARSLAQRNQQGILTPGIIYIIVGVIGIIFVVVFLKLRKRFQRKKE